MSPEFLRLRAVLPEKGLQHGVFRTIIEENVGKGEHMEIKRAAELLRGLADGVDPMTGRPLPDESVYNRPEIIRALHCVLRALQERADGAAATNAGRSWSAEEEARLLQEYDAGLTTETIARRHGRSIGAIETRLSELGQRDQIQFSMR